MLSLRQYYTSGSVFVYWMDLQTNPLFLLIVYIALVTLNIWMWFSNTYWLGVCDYSQEGKKRQPLCSERMFFHLQWFLFFSEPAAFTQSPFLHCGRSWCLCHCCSQPYQVMYNRFETFKNMFSSLTCTCIPPRFLGKMTEPVLLSILSVSAL